MSRTGSELMQPKDVSDQDVAWAMGLLNPKQQQFCHELLADEEFSATRAATKAGYRNPSSDGMRLLGTSKVAQVIGKAIHNRNKRMEVSADRVLQEWCRIGFQDPGNAYKGQVVPNLPDMPEDVRRAVSRFEVTYSSTPAGETFKHIKVWFWDKLEALGALARHLGLIKPDQLNVNLNRVEVNWVDLYNFVGHMAGFCCPKCGWRPEDRAEVVEHDDPVERRIAEVSKQ